MSHIVPIQRKQTGERGQIWEQFIISEKLLFFFLVVKKLRDVNVLLIAVRRKRIILDLIPHPNYSTHRPHCARLVRLH